MRRDSKGTELVGVWQKSSEERNTDFAMPKGGCVLRELTCEFGKEILDFAQKGVVKSLYFSSFALISFRQCDCRLAAFARRLARPSKGTSPRRGANGCEVTDLLQRS